MVDIPMQRALWTRRLGKAQWAFCTTVDSGRPFWKMVCLMSLEVLRTKAFLACNGEPAWDPVMTLTPRPQKPAGEEQKGGHPGRRYVLGRLNFPPTMLLHSFTISLILFIHSIIYSTNTFYVPDTALCPIDKIILKEYHFPPQPTPWQGDR